MTPPERGYQAGFYETHAGVRDELSRRRKAAKIASVLQRVLGDRLGASLCLDVGSSSGLITFELAPLFRATLGTDFDLPALRHAPRAETLTFAQADAMRLPIAAASIDVAICAQVYEHVPDDNRLAAELYRVLKPGGVVFFSGPNWLYPIEPHYFLPFLHWLPPRLAGLYLKLFRKGDSYYERSRTYWGLRRLWGQFQIEDVTVELLRARPGDLTITPTLAWALRAPDGWLRAAVPLMPNFNWLLRKPQGGS